MSVTMRYLYLNFRDLEDLKAKIETLNKEIEALNKENKDLRKNITETNSKPKFDIEDYKSSDEDISFYTGFPNYDTLILCFDLLKEKAKNYVIVTKEQHTLIQVTTSLEADESCLYGKSSQWFC